MLPIGGAIDLIEGGAPKKNIIIIAVVVAVIVVILIYIAYRQHSLAFRLKRAGWVLYTNQNCQFCQQQIALLKQPLTPVPHVDCTSGNNSACSSVVNFPYWVNTVTNANRTGLQTIDNIKQMIQTKK